MKGTSVFGRAGLALLLGLAVAACSQQAGSTPQQRTGGAGTGSAQGQGMSDTNMQQMMAHCAQMRQQVRAGGTLSPDMQAMLAQCDQMRH